MAIITPRFTYADLRDMPDDGRRYEVIGGDLCMSPAPKTRHQRIQGRLFGLLLRAEDAGFGVVLQAPVDVYFDDDNGVQPDVLFITKDNEELVCEDDVRGVPDLVGEVLSPGTRSRDLGAKLRLYARFGVRAYWVADPDAETVTVFGLGAGGYEQKAVLGAADTLKSALFPGIDMPVARVFARR